MQQLALDFSPPRPALSLWDSAPAEAAPSSAVVAAVLAFGDVREENEDGATAIRFSSHRVEREDIQLLLGAESGRALDVTVIWDEREMEIVRVVDLGGLRSPRRLQGRPVDAGRDRYARAKMRGFNRAA